MNKRHASALAAPLLCGLLCALSVAIGLANGTPTIEWWTFNGGGAPSSGGNVTLNDSLGIPIVGPSSGGTVSLGAGYWYGNYGPTLATLVGFWVEARADTLVARWETATEMGTLGFNVYRSESSQPSSFRSLNEELIPAQGDVVGAHYEWADADVAHGQLYFYLLEEVDDDGRAITYGPIKGFLPRHQYLPLLLKEFK
jgi:hypothetical protein